MIRSFWSHAKWFTEKSRDYVGHPSWDNTAWMPGTARYGFNTLTWRQRARWPRAFIRFMWLSRYDIWEGL